MAEYKHIANIKGPQGVRGRTGDTGLRGPEGPKGPEGPRGLDADGAVDNDQSSAQRIRDHTTQTHAALAEGFVTAVSSEHGVTLFQNGVEL